MVRCGGKLEKAEPIDYCDATLGVDGPSDATVRLDLDNEPSPDLMLRITGPRGSSRLDADGYVHGPRELVVEVAASSASYDLHQKLLASGSRRRRGCVAPRRRCAWRSRVVSAIRRALLVREPAG